MWLKNIDYKSLMIYFVKYDKINKTISTIWHIPFHHQIFHDQIQKKIGQPKQKFHAKIIKEKLWMQDVKNAITICLMVIKAHEDEVLFITKPKFLIILLCSLEFWFFKY